MLSGGCVGYCRRDSQQISCSVAMINNLLPLSIKRGYLIYKISLVRVSWRRVDTANTPRIKQKEQRLCHSRELRHAALVCTSYPVNGPCECYSLRILDGLPAALLHQTVEELLHLLRIHILRVHVSINGPRVRWRAFRLRRCAKGLSVLVYVSSVSSPVPSCNRRTLSR